MDTEPRPGTNQNMASLNSLGSRPVSEIEEAPSLTSVRSLQRDSLQNWEADFDSLNASPRGMTRASSPLQRGRGGSNDSSLMALSGKSDDRAGSIGSAGLLRLGGRKGWTASRWQVGSEKPQTMMPETSGPIHFPPQQQLNPRDLQRCYSTPQSSGTTPKAVGEPSLARTSGIAEATSTEDVRAAQADAMRAHTPGSSRGGQSGKSNLSKEWINMELDRLKSEYQFKSQIATMLRSTLAGMKTQRSRRLSQNSANGWSGPALPTHIMPDQEIVHPHAEKSAMEGVPAGMKPQLSPPQSPMHSHAPISPSEFSAMKSELQSRKKEVSDLESDIAALEAHVKLLNDALDDERQDNQDLSLENSMLKAQVEKLTAAGEKLLEGMTKMRSGQE